MVLKGSETLWNLFMVHVFIWRILKNRYTYTRWDGTSTLPGSYGTVPVPTEYFKLIQENFTFFLGELFLEPGGASAARVRPWHPLPSHIRAFLPTGQVALPGGGQASGQLLN